MARASEICSTDPILQSRMEERGEGQGEMTHFGLGWKELQVEGLSLRSERKQYESFVIYYSFLLIVSCAFFEQ